PRRPEHPLPPELARITGHLWPVTRARTRGLEGAVAQQGRGPITSSRGGGGGAGAPRGAVWPITSSSGVGGRGGTECAPVVPAASNSSIARSAVSTHPPPLTVRSSKIAEATGSGGGRISPRATQPPGRSDSTIAGSAFSRSASVRKNVGTH